MKRYEVYFSGSVVLLDDDIKELGDKGYEIPENPMEITTEMLQGFLGHTGVVVQDVEWMNESEV